jgi:methyl coenzyme M reductase subunit C
MEIKIIWDWKDVEKLNKITIEVIKELELEDFLKANILNLEEETKQLLNITKQPAFVICEPEIDFEDLIFEWFIPEKEDLKNMILGLVWFWWNSSCSWNCSWCSGC